MWEGVDELAKAAYENAKAKGFYDKPVSIPEWMALIHSELSEALEADRKDRYVDEEMFEDHGHTTTEHVVGYDDMVYKDRYDQWIKGTFEEEMADVVIRILDLAASMKRPIGAPDEMWPIWNKAKTTPEQLAVLHYHVSSALEAYIATWKEYPCYFWSHLFTVLTGCEIMCIKKGIDLKLHVEAKMRYNSLRPHMHGGKKY